MADKKKKKKGEMGFKDNSRVAIKAAWRSGGEKETKATVCVT